MRSGVSVEDYRRDFVAQGRRFAEFIARTVAGRSAAQLDRQIWRAEADIEQARNHPHSLHAARELVYKPALLKRLREIRLSRRSRKVRQERERPDKTRKEHQP